MDYETWGMNKTFYIGESVSAIAIKTFQNLLEKTGTEHKLYLHSYAIAAVPVFQMAQGWICWHEFGRS